MGLKEDIEKIDKKVEETSFAMEMLKFSKEQNTQLHKHNVALVVIIVLLILSLVGSNAYWIYEYTHTVDEDVIEYAETDDGGNACVGDSCNNGEIDYGEGLQEN